MSTDNLSMLRRAAIFFRSKRVRNVRISANEIFSKENDL